MRLVRGVALGAVAALALLVCHTPRGAATGRPVVILLSWDGVRHDFPDRISLPALERMARDGVRAGRLTPVFPSNTFPCHVSLATGTYPDRHGIVDNTFRDRSRGLYERSDDASWLEAEPLWVAAERQGIPAATFFWVGSETDWNGVGARHRVAPFDSSVKEKEKVDRIVAWLDLPEDERPGLIMSWWHGADGVAHRKGPDHADVAKALAAQDRQLSRLFAALDARNAWATTSVIVVSDHGMTAVGESVPVRTALGKAGISARVQAGSAVAHIFLKDPETLARAEAVLGELSGVEVHRRGALPESLRLSHPSRNGDLIALTSPPRTFLQLSPAQRLAAGAATLAGQTLGMHGYDPTLPEMGGIFFALGRGVTDGGRPGTVRAIDVAATVARLLEIAPPQHSEGVVIDGFGALRFEP